VRALRFRSIPLRSFAVASGLEHGGSVRRSPPVHAFAFSSLSSATRGKRPSGSTFIAAREESRSVPLLVSSTVGTGGGLDKSELLLDMRPSFVKALLPVVAGELRPGSRRTPLEDIVRRRSQAICRALRKR